MFTWDLNKMDENIFSHGEIVVWVTGGKSAIQKFVETLSHRIGQKCDWGYIGGRAHIDTLPENVPAAKQAILDTDWVRQFIIPVTDETFANGTYFGIEKIM